ncbi:hypothetical protein LEP1GSC198_0202 [Leptospira kirschneri str. JB]|nr:hypothetical protein LEP1GSC198_0202 [Leptospira kirschneri str. JB]
MCVTRICNFIKVRFLQKWNVALIQKIYSGEKVVNLNDLWEMPYFHLKFRMFNLTSN